MSGRLGHCDEYAIVQTPRVASPRPGRTEVRWRPLLATEQGLRSAYRSRVRQRRTREWVWLSPTLDL